MKKIYYKDLTIIPPLAIISMIWLMIPTLNNYPLNIIPYALLLLFLPGYPLLASIKPLIYQKEISVRILLSVILSIIISVLIFLILNFTQLKSFNIPLLVILFIISLLLSIIAFIMRKTYFNSPINVDNMQKNIKPSENENSQLTDDKKLINDEVIIKVENLGMEFNLSQEKIDNLKEYVIKLLKRELFYQEFWALKGVSFQVKKGEKLGIVGLNGAGKSTLLKLISGVMKPTEGSVEVNGSIVPLLELGAGFDPNYTGRENIFLNGALLGHSKSFMESKFDEIVEFSELDEFIDVPLKNYSSGMVARLGFSIATIIEPKILILDEILSVGDAKFQQKSEKRMKSFINKDVTVLFVSHSIPQVRELCEKAIWLDRGELIMHGTADEVCDKYMESIRQGAYHDQFNRHHPQL